MDLILSRHGNTFGPGDAVVWAGATNDLPLVARGEEQAKILAEVIQKKGIVLKAVYSGPLSRTRRYAEIVLKCLGLDLIPTIDSRLHEIDYGQWTGLTNAEVISQFGVGPLQDWDERCIWPQPSQGSWGASPTAVCNEIQSFAADLLKWHPADQDSVLVVSSNGRLRYFLTLVEGELERKIQTKAFKMKTGHIGRICLRPVHSSLLFWNQDPQML